MFAVREPPALGFCSSVGAPCFSRGSWTCLQQAGFSPAKKGINHKMGFSPGHYGLELCRCT